jgi:hypothetical protein
MGLKDRDGKMLELVEACISTWTDMTIADGEREGIGYSICLDTAPRGGRAARGGCGAGMGRGH